VAIEIKMLIVASNIHHWSHWAVP